MDLFMDLLANLCSMDLLAYPFFDGLFKMDLAYHYTIQALLTLLSTLQLIRDINAGRFGSGTTLVLVSCEVVACAGTGEI